MPAPTLLLASMIVSASAAPLRIDRMNPPIEVAPATETQPARYRFASDVDLPVLPAVVVVADADHRAPPAPGARSLGGRSWRIPTTDAAEAVRLALDLNDQPGVRSAFPDVLLPQAPLDAPEFDDPEYGGQWYLERLEMERLYAVSLGDPDVVVAVIDSGIDIGHVDLADAVTDPLDAWSNDDDPSPDAGEFCSGQLPSEVCDEHGTAVSGIVLARANNGAGIVGMCPTCTLVPIKLLGDGVGNSLSADLAAFEHVIAVDAAVANNSWGFTESIPVPEPLAEVIGRAATETRGGLGTLVVFAAGNDDHEIQDNELQALDDVLCVSAIDSYGYKTNYTNFGATVDVAAPSATVSIAPGDGITETFGGTSAAAPVVSGLAAWAVAQDPTLSAAELMDLLVDTAIPSPLVTADEDGHHDVFGYGVISAVGVMDALYPNGTGDTGDGRGVGCACTTSGRGDGAPPFAVLSLALLGWRVRRRSAARSARVTGTGWSGACGHEH